MTVVFFLLKIATVYLDLQPRTLKAELSLFSRYYPSINVGTRAMTVFLKQASDLDLEPRTLKGELARDIIPDICMKLY